MKSIFHVIKVVLGLMLLSGFADAAVSCESLKGCEQKICNLKNNIQKAKKADNANRVDGLVISLEKVEKYCTNEGLIEEIEDKISDVKKDLKEDNESYNEALKDGRTDKIKKYKEKIAEETQELEELEEELSQLK